MGGVRTRLKKCRFRPHVPSIILANVRSLRYKMDMLHAKCWVERAYKEACVIALTETWLDESVLDSNASLEGFTVIQAGRTGQSDKDSCGGVCIYVNDRWCNNIKVHNTICTPNTEILTLSPFLSPKRIPNSGRQVCLHTS